MYFNIIIYMLISISYKMHALSTSEITLLGEAALTVSPKIRFID